MKGALPPSSSESFFIVEEDCDMRILPTRVCAALASFLGVTEQAQRTLPVKEIFLTSGSSHSALPTAAVFLFVVITLTTPSGIPAR